MEQPIEGSSLSIYTALSTRAAVIALGREDLGDLLRSGLLDNMAASYVMTGHVGQRIRVRIGEGVKLKDRFADHRRDKSLAFVSRIFVIHDVARILHKNDAILLQERLTQLAQDAGVAVVHQRTGPLCDFPVEDADRRALEVVLAGALGLLRTAGCRAFDRRAALAGTEGGSR